MASDRTVSLIQSVSRAAEVLKSFSVEQPTLTASEIAARTGLHRTTIHRLLQTLEQASLVRQLPKSSRYTLDPSVLQFARIVDQVYGVKDAATPIMTSLRDKIQETIALHIRDGRDRVVTFQVEGNREVRRTYPVMGERIPLHIGSPGKSILAHLPEGERESYLAQPLVAVTELSHTNAEDLRQELDGIRAAGFAISTGERVEGVCSISAPIFDASNRVVAAITISAPAFRMTEHVALQHSPLLRQAAEEISARIGASASPR